MAAEKTVKQRKNSVPRGLKPWKPGESGNPNGRPPVNMALAQIVRDVGAEIIDEKEGRTRIEEVVRAQYRQAARGETTAAEWISKRGWGNVPIELNADLTEYTPEQLEEVRKKRWAEAGIPIAAALAAEEAQ